jgi:cardiolipin synthase
MHCSVFCTLLSCVSPRWTFDDAAMTRLRDVWLAAVLVLAGCGSSGNTANDNATNSQSEIDGEEPEYRVLVGRFAEQGVRESLVARDAFIGDDEFYISYRGADGVVYSGGDWSSRIDILAVENSSDGTYAGPYILPLEYQQIDRWDEVPKTPIEPRLLSADQWGRFREGLFASVIPQEPNAGIAMHFDTDDYFLYYNDIGKFEARLITEKPVNYRVLESIGFADFIRRGLPQLEVFLAAEGVDERRIVFNTGDAGPYSLPFLYVDMDLPIAVFVRYPMARRSEGEGGTGTQIAQSLGHVAQSHLGSLAIRPVSSLYRLLFAAKDAAVETVRPTWLVHLESQPIPEIGNDPGMDLAAWEAQLDSITGRESSIGTIKHLVDGQEYFTRLIDAITSAKESIFVRTYIFDNDDYADTIASLLKRRSNEDIEVKVLLDGLGTILATGAADEAMPEDYVPPASVRVSLESDSKIDVRQVKNPWMAGDHVKTTIIDEMLAFTGGMNIGREYRYTWHDLMMEVQGPIVDILRNEFHDAWAHAGALGDFGYFFHKLKPNRQLAGEGGYPIRVLFTRTGNAEIFNTQIAAIRNAQSYIYIQNAYFTDDAMLYELARARRRGVDVRVILPLVGNHGPINQSNVLAANAMLEHGIRVFLYPGMSHVKAAVFDGWACLGSANWDKLSFRVNKELNLATSHIATVEDLTKRVFEVDFAKSAEVTEPFPERWSDHLVEIVADYLL